MKGNYKWIVHLWWSTSDYAPKIHGGAQAILLSFWEYFWKDKMLEKDCDYRIKPRLLSTRFTIHLDHTCYFNGLSFFSCSPLTQDSNCSKLPLSQYAVFFHTQRHEFDKGTEYGEQWVTCDLVRSGKKWVWEKIGKNNWDQLVKNIVSHSKTQSGRQWGTPECLKQSNGKILF